MEVLFAILVYVGFFSCNPFSSLPSPLAFDFLSQKKAYFFMGKELAGT